MRMKPHNIIRLMRGGKSKRPALSEPLLYLAAGGDTGKLKLGLFRYLIKRKI